jgi:hypothetical protein
MKNIFFVLVLVIFGMASLNAEPSECNKKAKEAFETDKKVCVEKKGEERKTCMKEAKGKLMDANEACRKIKTECIEKAKSEKDAAMKECQGKKGEEKKTCNQGVKAKFLESKQACKK